MKTENMNLSKKITQAPHRDINEHFPRKPNQRWSDFKPNPYFIEQAFAMGCSVEEFISDFYN